MLACHLSASGQRTDITGDLIDLLWLQASGERRHRVAALQHDLAPLFIGQRDGATQPHLRIGPTPIICRICAVALHAVGRIERFA